MLGDAQAPLGQTVAWPNGLVGADVPRERCLSFRSVAQLFEFYVSRTPLSYAVFRVAECRALAGVPLGGQTLDLGCGTGEFAAWALVEPVMLGVDLSQTRLRRARRGGGHLLVARADVAALPIANASLASVLAVSVCEHLLDPATAVAEAFRVLRPGGRFVATIVLADIHEHLLYPRLLRTLRLRRLASLYLCLHDRVFDHVALHTREEWETMLSAAGFRLVVRRKIVSPRLMCWFDFWLITAWPYKLMQWGGVKPFVWRPKWVRRLCWKWFQAIDEECDEQGSVLLVVAEKPG